MAVMTDLPKMLKLHLVVIMSAFSLNSETSSSGHNARFSPNFEASSSGHDARYFPKF